MVDSSPFTSSSRNSSIPSSTTDSSPVGGQGIKIGRPNKWTVSRSRKLARLYLYSMLPPKDIPQALREDDWVPGKESTAKTVSTLLDTQPRWLRPKNREEMDKRIAGLSNCQAKRKVRREFLLPDEYGETLPQASDAIPSTDFTETPLDDLLAFAPEERFSSNVNYPATIRNFSVPYAVATSYQGIPYQDEQVLPSSMWQDSPTFDPDFDPPSPDVNMPPPIDQRSLSTYISTSSLKRRLPRYSIPYLKSINRLLDSFSISTTSVTTIVGPRTVEIETDDLSDGSRTILTLPDINSSCQNATLLLPNTFLRIDYYLRRQGICIPGLRSHDSKSCWCAVLDDLQSQGKFWVSGAGLVTDSGDPPTSLENIDLNFRDTFGNNVLHLLAARGAHLHIIMQAMEHLDDVNAKNTADQTFLHVLHHRLFDSLVEDKFNLINVLQHLNRFKVGFCDCDVFGQSFFHILTRRAENFQHNVVGALSFLNAKLPSARDAFGWTPFLLKDFESRYPKSAKQTVLRLPTLAEDSDPATVLVSETDSQLEPNDEAFISKHTRLLEISRLGLHTPSLEDSEGRNSLHCLAEVSLTMSLSNSILLPDSSHKRKRNEPNTLHPVSAPSTLRYQLVQGMLSVNVDINHYNLHGNTVLMAFVTHSCDGEDDKTLSKLFHSLIRNGANLHLRNRQGETALHIAVRLGRKIATRVLLENGANVHARTAEGKGVLAVGQEHYLKAKDDLPLYASIMACMALAIQFNAVAAPTLVQEWSTWVYLMH